MIRVIVALFGLFIAALGALGLMKPKPFTELAVKFWAMPNGLLYAAALRLALGIALLLAADQSAYPRTLVALGYLSVAGALAVVALGRIRIDKIVTWWMRQPDTVIRLWGLLALALGIFLLAAIR